MSELAVLATDAAGALECIADGVTRRPGFLENCRQLATRLREAIRADVNRNDAARASSGRAAKVTDEELADFFREVFRHAATGSVHGPATFNPKVCPGCAKIGPTLRGLISRRTPAGRASAFETPRHLREKGFTPHVSGDGRGGPDE